MKVAAKSSGIRVFRDLSEITGIVAKRHPHVLYSGPILRMIERLRIRQALTIEADALEYVLVAAIDNVGEPEAGAVLILPRDHARARFSAYGDRPAFFGFLFGFHDAETVATVFAACGELAREVGADGLYGPMEATINYQIGLEDMPSPFQPGLLMPRNPEDWPGYLEAAGLRRVERLFTSEIAFADGAAQRFFKRDVAVDGLEIEAIRPPFSQSDRDALKSVFNAGWSDNWGFVALEENGVRALEKEFKLLLWPGLAYVARVKGEAVAMAVAVPDLNEIGRAGTLAGELSGLWRLLARRRARAVKLLLLGITPGYQGSLKGFAIVERMIWDIKTTAETRYGVTHLQMGWTLASNRPVNRLIDHWAPGALRAVHGVWRMDL